MLIAHRDDSATVIRYLPMQQCRILIRTTGKFRLIEINFISYLISNKDNICHKNEDSYAFAAGIEHTPPAEMLIAKSHSLISPPPKEESLTTTVNYPIPSRESTPSSEIVPEILLTQSHEAYRRPPHEELEHRRCTDAKPNGAIKAVPPSAQVGYAKEINGAREEFYQVNIQDLLAKQL